MPPGRLSKHEHIQPCLHMKASTQIYVRAQPNTNRAVICVSLHLIQQMLPLQRKFVDSDLLCCCYNKASVLHFHHRLRWGWWLAACTRSRKQRLLWHAAHNKSMLCDMCAHEVKLLTVSTGANENGVNGAHFDRKRHLNKSETVNGKVKA